MEKVMYQVTAKMKQDNPAEGIPGESPQKSGNSRLLADVIGMAIERDGFVVHDRIVKLPFSGDETDVIEMFCRMGLKPRNGKIRNGPFVTMDLIWSPE